jgi:co-chaperonin GroES (HSP10)
MKLEALYNALIVKPIELEETTYGNIVIPDLGNEKNKVAEVINVGPGMVVAGVGFIPTVVKPGDKVILPTVGFTKFEFEGEEYWIGPENECLCKINDN